jgi:hypothetical protein
MRLISTLIFPLLTISVCWSQHYYTAVGGRISMNKELAGITVQQRVARRITIETLGEFAPSSYTKLTVLAERHIGLLGGHRFNAYLGIGPHAGTWRDTTSTKFSAKNMYFGATGTAGLELTVGRFCASAAVEPTINLYTKDRKQAYFIPQVSIAARYVLIPLQHRRLRELRKKSDSIQ